MELSIVTPSFRQLEWLKLCAASVADQNDVEKEHIVQDAGTGSDLEVWAKNIPQMRLFAEPDNGMYDAINRGLLRSNGEICAYLNCDEQYLPGTLAKVARFFHSHPQIDVLFGDAIVINPEGLPISYRRTILPWKTHVHLAHLCTLSCAMFFRRIVFEKGYLFDTQLKDLGDAAWVETLLSAGVNMATMRAPLAVFTFTGQNRSALATARAERLRRREDFGSFEPLHRITAVLQHRIRKALAGAYRSRHIAIDVYTTESPTRRLHIVRDHVGFGWPQTTGISS